MDFPETFSSTRFVTGVSELRQMMKSLLSNSVRQFLQSPSIGSLIPEHSVDIGEIEYGVRQTLSEIQCIEILSVSIETIGTELYARVVVQYKKEVIESLFPL